MQIQFIIVFLVLFCYGCSALNINQNDQEQITLFQLNPQSLKLLKEVEQLYGRNIKMQAVNTNNKFYGGESTVLEDGTPVIKVNLFNKFKEETIVHELFHLKFRKKGFPRLKFAYYDDFKVSDNDVQMIGNIFAGIRDVIEHFIFYPEIRNMGLDPHISMKDMYKESNFNNLSIHDPVSLTANYVKIVLDSNDQKLISLLEQHYEKNKWVDSINNGKRLIQIIKDSNPKNPKDEINTTLKCMNNLLGNKYEFSVVDWQTEKKGMLIDNVVIVLIRPSQYFK